MLTDHMIIFKCNVYLFYRLDMGFEPQISQLLQQTDKNIRQTLCFTATWPREVQNLAMSYLKTPVQLNIGESDLLTANSSIIQHIKFVQEHDKMDTLHSLLVQLKSEFLVKQEQDNNKKILDASNTTAITNTTSSTTTAVSVTPPKVILGKKTEPKIILFTSRKMACDDICHYLTGM